MLDDECNPRGADGDHTYCTDTECILCGAPGGHPYCNEDCKAADNPEDDEEWVTHA